MDNTTRARNGKQSTKNRRNFERTLKKAKCPEDNTPLEEVNQPEVVCPKCGTHYNINVKAGLLLVKWRLTDAEAPTELKPVPPSPIAGGILPREYWVIEEHVRVKCTTCGNLYEEWRKRCPYCGHK